MMAVITLTGAAALLGQKVKNKFSQTDLYVSGRFKGEYQDCFFVGEDFSGFVALLWDRYSHFVFIMASGIVVRAIAPLLKNKKIDPAVVVLDEKGDFAISLVSGHAGGANALARKLAVKLGATPVITTASDIQGIPSIDELARKWYCVLEHSQDLKKITWSVLHGEKIAILTSVKLEVDFPPNVQVYAIDKINKSFLACRGVVYIIEKTLDFAGESACQLDSLEPGKLEFAQELPYVVLRPRNIIVGIGCRRGTPKENIRYAIENTLENAGISINSIACLATITVKSDEKGLIEAAEELGVSVRIITPEEIQAVEGQFKGSDFVKKQVGVGAVAEPAAWLAAKKPEIITGKNKYPGITVAVVKDIGVVLSG